MRQPIWALPHKPSRFIEAMSPVVHDWDRVPPNAKVVESKNVSNHRHGYKTAKIIYD